MRVSCIANIDFVFFFNVSPAFDAFNLGDVERRQYNKRKLNLQQSIELVPIQ